MRRSAFAPFACAALLLLAPPAAADPSDYVPPKIETSTPTGVALSDGSFIYSNTDISIGPLTLERFHIGGAQDSSGSYFGPFMSHNFDMYVARNFHQTTQPPGSRYKPIVHLGQSASGVFLQAFPDVTLVTQWTPDSLTDTLAFINGDYQYTAHDGTIYNFTHTVSAGPSGSQRIANIIYPGGRRLDFSYVNGLLKLVTDNSGYAIVFDYSGSVVSAACGFNLAVTYVTTSTTCTGAALRTSYGYDGNGHLTSITDVMGQMTTLEYVSATVHQISCVKPPTHTTCRIANVYGIPSARWQVTQQTLADGTVWNFAPTQNPQRYADQYVIEDGQQLTTVTDPLTHVQYYRFTASSPYQFTDALGRQTQYRYSNNYDPDSDLAENPPPNNLHDGRLLELVTFPEGNTYSAAYGGPFRSISTETWTPKPSDTTTPAAVIQYLYGTCTNLQNFCTQPIARIDPRNARTDFHYTSYGLLEWQMDPEPYGDASRPLHLYTYVQRYAYIRNSGGTLVPAATPVWVKSTETQCQTVAGPSSNDTPTCDPNGPQVVTTYNYPANGTTHTNLLPASTTVSGGAISNTTATTYTDYGDVASVDGPRTDVSDITYSVYDAMRRKVFEIGADTGGAVHAHRVMVRRVFSADGNEISTETGHGDATDGSDFVIEEYRHMTYDGMGRLIRTEVGTP